MVLGMVRSAVRARERGTGMGGGVDGGQALGGDPCVDLGGAEIAVAEQFLDVADVRPRSTIKVAAV